MASCSFCYLPIVGDYVMSSQGLLAGTGPLSSTSSASKLAIYIEHQLDLPLLIC